MNRIRKSIVEELDPIALLNPLLGYVKAPDDLPGFPDAKREKSKSQRKRWKDRKKKHIYEWDSLHGELEKWDWKGRKHLGSFDPDGRQIKPPDPTKQPITPTSFEPMNKKEYTLTWFSADSDDFVGKEKVLSLTEEKVKELFYIPDNEPAIWCYPVRASQRLALMTLAEHKIDLNKYDYFIEWS